MTRHRTLLRTAFLLVAMGALLPLAQSAKAGDPICCSDVKFPEYRADRGAIGPYLVVDGIGHGAGVYRYIQEALDDARPGSQIMVKPAPGGVYEIDKPLIIRRPVTLSNFGGAGIVRIRAADACAVVDLRRDGKVTISGLSFETAAPSGACIDVVHASDFALMASDITAVEGEDVHEGNWCAPIDRGAHPKLNCKLVGVLIESGLATIQGNRIRRTGTAIALVNPAGEAHKVQGNYIAGNGIGVYVAGGAKFLIERNGIFRNHEFGVNIADGVGLVADNDIEDNWTGLKIIPPSAFSSTAYAPDGSAATDYSDMSRAVIRIERNLVTQYGIYRPYGHDFSGASGQSREIDGKKLGDQPADKAARFGYALDFAVDDQYLQDNVYDYPKRGSVLSGIAVSQNCFFGPATSLFDRDRFMPLIAPNSEHDTWKVPASGGYKSDSFSSSTHHDALTPLWFYDVNTWVEHLDYDAVDKIDHDNEVRSPRYDGFSGGLWTAIHNWFARNKKEMVCAFRFQEPVVSAPGNWPRFDTNPVR